MATTISTNYGDYVGTTVEFLQVTESTDEANFLYNAPTISLNTLDFDPTGFVASSGGGGADITDGQLNFTICSLPGNFIDQVLFSEAGDYTLVGGGTSGTYVQVSAPVTIEIYQVDGAAITPINVTQYMTFTPPDGKYDLINDGPAVADPWSGGVSFDVNQILVDNGVDFDVGATKVDFYLDNTLVAISEVGTQARIAKKDFSGFTITVTPEPSTIGLLVIGVLGMSLRRRR